MKVVIAGEGALAHRLAEILMAEHQVSWIIPEEANGHGDHDRLDVEVVSGAITSPESLRAATIKTTNVFVACGSNDEQNIVACIAAQRLGAGRTICVLTRPGFLSLGEDEDALAESLGIDQIVRPAEQLAEEMLRIVAFPGALEVEELAGGRVALLRYRIEPNALITTKPLRQLSLPSDCVLVSLRRNDEFIVPTGETRIQAGDKIVAMGKRSGIRRLSVFLRDIHHLSEKRRVAIVGAGSVGLRIASGLKDAHWDVKLIEFDRARCERVAQMVDALVLHGDGADLEFLEQENIGDLPAVITVTNNDERNLLISLLMKQLGVKRIITRADRLSNERMFEKVGIDVVRSAKGAALRSILKSIDNHHSEIRAELEHGSACVLEIQTPENFPVRRLRDIRPPAYSVVGSIMRGRRLITPRGQDEIHPGDQLLVFCASDDRDKISDFYCSAELNRRQLEGNH